MATAATGCQPICSRLSATISVPTPTSAWTGRVVSFSIPTGPAGEAPLPHRPTMFERSRRAGGVSPLFLPNRGLTPLARRDRDPYIWEISHDSQRVGGAVAGGGQTLEGGARQVLANVQTALRPFKRPRVAEREGHRIRFLSCPQGDHSHHGARRHGQQASAGALFVGGQARDGAVAAPPFLASGALARARRSLWPHAPREQRITGLSSQAID